MSESRKRKLIQRIQQEVDEFNRIEGNSSQKVKLNGDFSFVGETIKINLSKREENQPNAFDILMAHSKAKQVVEKARKTNEDSPIQEKQREEEEKDDGNQKEEEEKKDGENQKEEEEKEDKGKKVKVVKYRKFTPQEREQIIQCHIDFSFEYTMIKHGIKEGTLKSLISRYCKEGEDAFEDKRKMNGREAYSEYDEYLMRFFRRKRELSLPVTIGMIKSEALTISQSPKFSASNCWAKNFMKRNKLTLRKKTQQLKNLVQDYVTVAEKYFYRLNEILSESAEVLFVNFDEVNLPFDMAGEQRRKMQSKCLF